jgi:hypothetical protein
MAPRVIAGPGWGHVGTPGKRSAGTQGASPTQLTVGGVSVAPGRWPTPHQASYAVCCKPGPGALATTHDSRRHLPPPLPSRPPSAHVMLLPRSLPRLGSLPARLCGLPRVPAYARSLATAPTLRPGAGLHYQMPFDAAGYGFAWSISVSAVSSTSRITARMRHRSLPPCAILTSLLYSSRTSPIRGGTKPRPAQSAPVEFRQGRGACICVVRDAVRVRGRSECVVARVFPGVLAFSLGHKGVRRPCTLYWQTQSGVPPVYNLHYCSVLDPRILTRPLVAGGRTDGRDLRPPDVRPCTRMTPVAGHWSLPYTPVSNCIKRY